MKLPRDVSYAALERALNKAFGYAVTRQVGSHRRLTTSINGTHHLTIPAHTPVKLGTFRSIIREVSSHHRLTIEEVLRTLNL